MECTRWCNPMRDENTTRAATEVDYCLQTMRNLVDLCPDLDVLEELRRTLIEVYKVFSFILK